MRKSVLPVVFVFDQAQGVVEDVGDVFVTHAVSMS